MSNEQLTTRQKEVLIGWLLSDGNMKKSYPSQNANASFWLGQSKYPVGKPERTESIEWTFNELLPFSSIIAERKGKSEGIHKIKQSLRIICSTRNYPSLTEVYNEWYQTIDGKNVKIVPPTIRLTSLIVAVWAMGDGINRPNKRSYSFCTDSFSDVDKEILINSFRNELAIEAKLIERGRIGIYGDENYLKLISCITPYILPCFYYKCDLSKYRSPIIGEERSYVKIKESEGHVDWIFAKKSENMTTQQIADSLYEKYGIEVSHGTISNVLKRNVIFTNTNLSKGKKRTKESIDATTRAVRLKPPKTKSGFKGVSKCRNKYKASVRYEYSTYLMGVFDTAEEAAKNYDYHCLELFGKDNCYLNFPNFDYTGFKPKILTIEVVKTDTWSDNV
jgi:hypothetical protein